MIRNSGSYGQNEVPVNVGPSLNVPHHSTPAGSANNLSKYANSGVGSSSSHYAQQGYSNMMHPALNLGQFPPYGRPLPYNIDSLQTMPIHPNLNVNSHSNYSLPMNLNANNANANLDLMQYQFAKSYNRVHPEMSHDYHVEHHKSSVCNAPPMGLYSRYPENAGGAHHPTSHLSNLLSKRQDVDMNGASDLDLSVKHDLVDDGMNGVDDIGKIVDLAVKSEAPVPARDVAVAGDSNDSDVSIKEENEEPIDEATRIPGKDASSEAQDAKSERSVRNDDAQTKEPAPSSMNVENDVDAVKESPTFNPFIKDVHGIIKECIELEKYTVLGAEDALNIVKNGEPPHLGTNQNAFECPRCSLIFLHPKRYTIHTKWHTFGNTKSKKLLRREAVRQEKLEQRKLVADAKKTEEDHQVSCPECGKVFLNSKSMNNHRQRYHNVSPKQCKLCHKSLLNWKVLRKHMMTVHSQDCVYTCSVCPKTFKFARSLQKHQDTHLEKIYPCLQCDKKFGSALLVSIHSKTHEKEKNYHCSYCGKGFYDTYTLSAHERTHRNERPYPCQICHTSFGTNSGLKRHLKVSHSTLKPHECPVCHRSFTTPTIRDRHQLRHHGDPARLAHACALCPSRYLTAKDLQKHCNKVHALLKRKRRRRASDDH